MADRQVPRAEMLTWHQVMRSDKDRGGVVGGREHASARDDRHRDEQNAQREPGVQPARCGYACRPR